MRQPLLVTPADGPVPDFAFFAAHDLALVACASRTTRHARFRWRKRAINLHIRNFAASCAAPPSFGGLAHV